MGYQKDHYSDGRWRRYLVSKTPWGRAGLLTGALSFVNVLLASSGTAGVPPSMPVEMFSRWDTEHNPKFPTERPQVTTIIEHLEIALDEPGLYEVADNSAWYRNAKGLGLHAVVIDLADYLPDDIRDLIVVRKNGRRYLRYFLAPGDTKYGAEVEAYLKQRQVPYTRERDFEGRNTASKSWLITDPRTGRTFSAKMSTNEKIGFHSDDAVPMHWAHLNRRLSDYYYSMRHLLKYLDVAWEAAAIGFPVLGSAYQIRLVEALSEGREYHASLFVLYSDDEAKRLARLSGLTFNEFWSRAVYAQARASVEMAVVLGFNFGSSHEQNGRFIFDQNFQPQDRSVILDLSDGSPVRPIFEANGQSHLLEEWHRYTTGAYQSPVNWPEESSFDISRFILRLLPQPLRGIHAQGIADGLRELTSLDEDIIEGVRYRERSGYPDMRGALRIFKFEAGSAANLLRVLPNIGKNSCTALGARSESH